MLKDLINKYAVLIPTYNDNLENIEKTFSSIPFDANILVIDDGSKIPFESLTAQALCRYINLKIKRLEINQGIENALNIGSSILSTEYKYIARLDIGDYGPSNRFEKQVSYLEENPDCVLVGTWGKFIDIDGKELFISKLPVEDATIRKKMYLNNMFIHPSVMMRSDSLIKVGGYQGIYKSCEDYDLFFRLMSIGKVHNLPEVLINYEVNFLSISSLKRKTQIKNRLKLQLKYFKIIKFGFFPIYGIFRTLAILFVSRENTNRIRTLLKK